jgi:hypothetical protein
MIEENFNIKENVLRQRFNRLRFNCLLLLAALTFTFFSAAKAQEIASVSLGFDNKQLRISLNPLQAIDRNQTLLLSNILNYALYEIEFPDEPAKMRGVEKKIFAGAPDCEFDCSRIKIPLTEPLGYDKTYMLKVSGLTLDKKAVRPLRFEVKNAAVITASLDNSRKKIRVRAIVPVEEASKNLIVKETILKISDAGDKVAAAVKENTGKVIDSSANNELTIELDKKLSENGTYYLNIENDLTDGKNVEIKAAGKIKIAGLPAAPTAIPIDIKISTSIANGQKPYFDLTANFGLPEPWNPDGAGKWYIEPKLTADIGLGQTKTKNSIILNVPFKRDLRLAGNENGERIPELNFKNGEVAKIPNYYGWRRTPWHRLTSVEFRIGPKIEADRRFARINTIGSVRFDFNFSRWQSSIAERREYLNDDLGKERADQVFLNRGFRLVPFLNFDFGRKITAEVVENKKKRLRLLIPQYTIARARFGFINLYEWYLGSFPMTLTIEENFQYLFKKEVVGTVTADGVDLRGIRGFHHQGRASIDVFLDRAKRYSFNVTYENGRTSPNFEYLNKVTTGFRLLY